eukprot:3081044-Amphidinium_carterae.1
MQTSYCSVVSSACVMYSPTGALSYKEFVAQTAEQIAKDVSMCADVWFRGKDHFLVKRQLMRSGLCSMLISLLSLP